MTDDRLREALGRMGLQDAHIDIDGRPRHWVVEIISPAFEGVASHVRQARVWDHLLRELSENESVEVEYIFTKTPEEVRAMEQEQRAAG